MAAEALKIEGHPLEKISGGKPLRKEKKKKYVEKYRELMNDN